MPESANRETETPFQRGAGKVPIKRCQVQRSNRYVRLPMKTLGNPLIEENFTWGHGVSAIRKTRQTAGPTLHQSAKDCKRPQGSHREPYPDIKGLDRR